MLRTILLILVLAFSSFYSNGQGDDPPISQVLEKGIVDSLFIFGKWDKNGSDETHLRYLGQVTTKSGQIFKILNSSWFWGHAHRATSRILVFNKKNQYVGDYYLTTVDDLPTKLKNGCLIFYNVDADCNKQLVTTVNLKNGLPKDFFRKCKGNYGDIYYFESY